MDRITDGPGAEAEAEAPEQLTPTPGRRSTSIAAAAPARRTTLRGGQWLFGAVVLAAAAVACAVAAVVGLVLASTADDGSDVPLPLRASAGVVAAVLLWLAYRLLSARIVIDEDHLTVRNVFSQRRIPWADVRAVRLTRRRNSNGSVCGAIVATADGSVRASAAAVPEPKLTHLDPLVTAATTRGITVDRLW